jgi:hypothetical protein
MSTHISSVGQACSGSTTLRLWHDGVCTLSVSAPAGGEVLTLGGAGSGGPTLTTSYKITGFADQDTSWVGSSAFLSRTYSVTGSGLQNMTLWVQGAPPANRAAEAGAYTAAIVITVTF